MALLTLVEAALKTGFSVELIESVIEKCPKPGEKRLLASTSVQGVPHIDEKDVDEYKEYLRSPWPKRAKGRRPRIPEAIARDVRAEAYHECAICGLSENGELAHIDPVAVTLDNSPDNLLLLCPNHHTKYDYGFKASSNIDREAVLAAKRVKRESRKRMLLYEGNVMRALRAALVAIRKLDEYATSAPEGSVRLAYTTELQALLNTVPELTGAAQDAAARDEAFSEIDAELLGIAPTLMRLAQKPTAATEAETRSAARQVIEASESVIDELECPHCGGRGTTGLFGNLCAFCRGSQVVSEEKASEYDPSTIDEVECPHCRASGTTGLLGDVCAFCRGSQVVSQATADEYDASTIDEVECPHCRGSGTTGLLGDVCVFCRGSQVVSEEKASEYDPSMIDEVECPHCRGSGTTGFLGDVCVFCRGSQVVSQATADEYDPSAIDEVECPRCGGRGTTGLVGDVCRLCRGRSVVTRAIRAAWEARA